MSVVEGLKIQIHVCGTYVLSVWFTLLIGFGSVWIFSRLPACYACYVISVGFAGRQSKTSKQEVSGAEE